MEGLSVVFSVIIIIIAILIPNTKRPKVLEKFKKLGKELGFNANVLEQVDTSIKKFKAFDKAIEGFVDNRKLRIKAKEVSNGDSNYWTFMATWQCQNIHRLKVDLFQEGVFNKVRKKFGMQDIEIFNEDFDNRFIIQCNHRHFPLQMFSNQFCEKILKLSSKLGKIEVSQNSVRYTENICLDDDQKIKRLKNIVLEMRELATMVDSWTPTYKKS